MRKIALISEHVSPMSAIDSAGQNSGIGQLARQLGRFGYQVDVFTRRHGSLLASASQWQPNVRVIHVPAGPARLVPKAALLRMMPAFGEWMGNFFARERSGYDLIHAHSFMSGHAALPVARSFALPLVMSFHSLGAIVRRDSTASDPDDGIGDRRIEIEAQLVREADRIIAGSRQERDDLLRQYDANVRKIDIVPVGFDQKTPAAPANDDALHRPPQRLQSSGEHAACAVASTYEVAMGFDRLESIRRMTATVHPLRAASSSARVQS